MTRITYILEPKNCIILVTNSIFLPNLIKACRITHQLKLWCKKRVRRTCTKIVPNSFLSEISLSEADFSNLLPRFVNTQDHSFQLWSLTIQNIVIPCLPLPKIILKFQLQNIPKLISQLRQTNPNISSEPLELHRRCELSGCVTEKMLCISKLQSKWNELSCHLMKIL